MSEVYVVEAGEYSDTWVVGVYTVRDNADAVAREHDGRVEKHLIDPPLSDEEKRRMKPGERLYHVRIAEDESIAWPMWVPEPPTNDLQASLEQGAVVGQCWARSKKHAIKIINDRRLSWIAAGSPLNGKKRPGGWRKVNTA